MNVLFIEDKIIRSEVSDKRGLQPVQFWQIAVSYRPHSRKDAKVGLFCLNFKMNG